MGIQFDSAGRIIVPKKESKKEFSKEDLIFWKEKYDSAEDVQNKEVEKEIGDSLRNKKFMDKGDFIRILKWKFQGKLRGRQKRMLNVLGDFPSDKIESLTREAFSSNEDYDKLELLSEIPAIQNSLASVILSFYEPENYGSLI
jgi:hypothetical protein